MSKEAISTRIPEPGEIFAGKFRIRRVLGEGGMGVVLEATHLRLGHEVALKVLSSAAARSAEASARFLREARAAVSLRGAHVARVLDADVAPESGMPYLVMELLEGHDLARELELRGKLPLGEAARYVLEACDAMREAHARGIVHRDLKPENLFLAPTPGRAGEGATGERRSIKVLDFGISKITGPAAPPITSTQSVFGTPGYMSPEQVRSTKDVDGRTDVWALGVILFQLLTGKLPFQGDTATARIAAIIADEPSKLGDALPELPPAICELVARALAKDREARPASVEAFAFALEPFRDWSPDEGLPPALGTSPLARTAMAPAPGAAAVSAPTRDLGSPRRTRPRASPRALAAGAALSVALLALGAAASRLADRGEAAPISAQAPGPPPPVEAPEAAPSAPPPSTDTPSESAPSEGRGPAHPAVHAESRPIPVRAPEPHPRPIPVRAPEAPSPAKPAPSQSALPAATARASGGPPEPAPPEAPSALPDHL